jgi:thioredoxin 1
MRSPLSNRPTTVICGLVVAAVLAGCGSQSASQAGPAAQVSTTTSATKAATDDQPTDQAKRAGVYLDYAAYQSDPGKYAGTKVVLFFHAPWCPSCRATEEDVLARRDSLPSGLTLVKTDYDSQTDLKKKYGVTTQHTFVLVDPAGQPLKKWNGSLTVDDIVAKAA